MAYSDYFVFDENSKHIDMFHDVMQKYIEQLDREEQYRNDVRSGKIKITGSYGSFCISDRD